MAPIRSKNNRAHDENLPCQSSGHSGAKPSAPDTKKGRFPRPNNLSEALEEFTGLCSEDDCRTCYSQPELKYSHCPFCDYDATDGEEFTAHIEGHIKKTEFSVDEMVDGEVKQIKWYQCLLKNCMYEDGTPHCGKQPGNIAGHMNCVLKQRPFKCHKDGCDASFPSHSGRSKHERHVHNLERVKERRAAELNGKERAEEQTDYPPRKPRGRSRKAKKIEDVFDDVPDSVRRATPANEEPIAGPSSGPSSRTYPFAPSSSLSSRKYNTSVPTADPPYASLDLFARLSPWVNSDPSPAAPLAVEDSSFTGSLDTFFDPLLAPANDIWPPNIPPENSDDCLHRPDVPSLVQSPEYPYDVESLDPASYSPPLFDPLAFESELDDAPPSYPVPTANPPAFNAPSNPAFMPYMPESFFASAQVLWNSAPWNVYVPGYLPGPPGNSF